MTQPHPATSELLPCPWCNDPCGIEEVFQDGPNGTEESIGFNVGCGEVNCPINPCSFATTKEEAIEKWNRRTQPAACLSGWGLYPKVPTQAMRDAYDRAPRPGSGWWAWKVMTEAAPPPPASAEGKRECRPLDEWNEDFGPAVWWKFPVDEPPWIGRPCDEDWPGYHTHWTPHPSTPDPPATAGEVR